MSEEHTPADLIRFFPSPLGTLTVHSDGRSITRLFFADDEAAPGGSGAELPVFSMTAEWLARYFSGQDPGFLPPLRLSPTPFRREVEEIMLTLPYGETLTYGEIAGIIARRRGMMRMSAQAVGGAVGANPIALIIPCHRVVGSGGRLVGYGGGIDRKIALLTRENARFLHRV